MKTYKVLRFAAIFAFLVGAGTASGAAESPQMTAQKRFDTSVEDVKFYFDLFFKNSKIFLKDTISLADVRKLGSGDVEFLLDSIVILKKQYEVLQKTYGNSAGFSADKYAQLVELETVLKQAQASEEEEEQEEKYGATTEAVIKSDFDVVLDNFRKGIKDVVVVQVDVPSIEGKAASKEEKKLIDFFRNPGLKLPADINNQLSRLSEQQRDNMANAGRKLLEAYHQFKSRKLKHASFDEKKAVWVQDLITRLESAQPVQAAAVPKSKPTSPKAAQAPVTQPKKQATPSASTKAAARPAAASPIQIEVVEEGEEDIKEAEVRREAQEGVRELPAAAGEKTEEQWAQELTALTKRPVLVSGYGVVSNDGLADAIATIKRQLSTCGKEQDYLVVALDKENQYRGVLQEVQQLAPQSLIIKEEREFRPYSYMAYIEPIIDKQISAQTLEIDRLTIAVDMLAEQEQKLAGKTDEERKAIAQRYKEAWTRIPSQKEEAPEPKKLWFWQRWFSSAKKEEPRQVTPIALKAVQDQIKESYIEENRRLKTEFVEIKAQLDRCVALKDRAKKGLRVKEKTNTDLFIEVKKQVANLHPVAAQRSSGQPLAILNKLDKLQTTRIQLNSLLEQQIELEIKIADLIEKTTDYAEHLLKAEAKLASLANYPQICIEKSLSYGKSRGGVVPPCSICAIPNFYMYPFFCPSDLGFMAALRLNSGASILTASTNTLAV